MSEGLEAVPDSTIQALADQAEQGTPALLGVVSPPGDLGPFEEATQTVSRALDEARARLIAKRRLRDATEAEIKVLVGQVEQLKRMWRVAERGNRNQTDTP